MGIDIKGKLAGMKTQWKKSREEAEKGFSGNTVPAGIYLMKISESNVGENTKGGINWFLKIVVLEGEHKGDIISTMFNLSHEVGQQFTCNFISAMGYEVPDDIDDVPEIAKTFEEEEITFRGQLKYNKDGYAGIRVLEVLETGTTAAIAEVEAADEANTADEADVAEETTEPEAEPVDEMQVELLAFCAANGIEEVTDASTVDEIKTVLSEYSMKEEELDKEEIDLLTRAGMSSMIEKKKPAATKKKK